MATADSATRREPGASRPAPRPRRSSERRVRPAATRPRSQPRRQRVRRLATSRPGTAPTSGIPSARLAARTGRKRERGQERSRPTATARPRSPPDARERHEPGGDGGRRRASEQPLSRDGDEADAVPSRACTSFGSSSDEPKAGRNAKSRCRAATRSRVGPSASPPAVARRAAYGIEHPVGCSRGWAWSWASTIKRAARATATAQNTGERSSPVGPAKGASALGVVDRVGTRRVTLPRASIST
jgi:hypothetical protein